MDEETVQALGRDLAIAIENDDDEAGAQAGVALLIGALLNLARIAKILGEHR
jgi:hypothetical protein